MTADPMGDMLIDLLAGTVERFDGLNVKNAKALIEAYRSSRHEVAKLRAATRSLIAEVEGLPIRAPFLNDALAAAHAALTPEPIA